MNHITKIMTMVAVTILITIAGCKKSSNDPKSDKSVLHPNFFYSFSAIENKVGAGLNTGTVIRTENYISIGNIAAWVDDVAGVGNEDKEFMVLVNGKLEVGYHQKKPYMDYYGTFTQK